MPLESGARLFEHYQRDEIAQEPVAEFLHQLFTAIRPAEESEQRRTRLSGLYLSMQSVENASWIVDSALQGRF